MSKYFRKTMKTLKPYVAGEQPSRGSKVIKLNTNENPYPPSPNVRRALRTFSAIALKKYPQPLADTFREAAAKVFGVRPEMIIAGNGSDDIINIAIRAFVDVGERIAYPVPTYSLYSVLANIQQAQTLEIPFDDSFDVPKGLAEAQAKLTFIANPNAPTGTFIRPEKIEHLARKTKGIVAVDEAYADFADANCLELVKRLPNVLVLRTLSKSYSLAGLRFGFAIGQPQLIEDMNKVKDSYNCDALAITLAAKAIEDQAYLAKTVARIRRQRQGLTRGLISLGFSVLPSQANFVWATIHSPPAKQIYMELKRRGILVRYFDHPGLTSGLRISVGSSKDNHSLIKALASIV
jgi:histidinol-phosphate aminotransferase